MKKFAIALACLLVFSVFAEASGRRFLRFRRPVVVSPAVVVSPVFVRKRAVHLQPEVFIRSRSPSFQRSRSGQFAGFDSHGRAIFFLGFDSRGRAVYSR